jgi:hypothetical protein
MTTGDWSDAASSYASVEIHTPMPVLPRASLRPVVMTTLLMLALTTAFWEWVVPRLL